MSGKLRIWVVTADGARAHLFVYDNSADRLRSAELAGLPAPEERLESRYEKSDRPGRAFASSGGGVRHALESHSDYRKLEKHKVAVAVAEAINLAAAAKEFDRLVLVAPPRSVGELRQYLSDQVQSEMVVISKDLVKEPVAKIWEHVAAAVHRSLR